MTVSISEASAAIRAGQLTPSQLVTQCLDRIDRTERELHAWVQVDRGGAMQAAESLERELDAGRCRGPLHGMPIGIKDIIDVAGLPTQAGSPLRRSHMAAVDSPVVARLRTAGAIVLGKTVTTQFACFDPPQTVNPHDPSRTPGGSSSGSAVAVATGTCLAALGSQTGGSITRPASYCGVVGFKPTKDRWSMDGVVPVSTSLDHIGPIAQNVEDLWPLWHGVVGASVKKDADTPRARQPLRFAFPQGFFRSAAAARMLDAIDAAVQRPTNAGAEVEPVDLPEEFDAVLAMHRRIMAVELAGYHRRWFVRHRDHYAPGIASLIEEGLGISSADYQAALQHRLGFIQAMQRAFADGPEYWITPATTTPAPGRETTGDPAFNAPWSYCGFPTVSVPCGTVDGLPVSLQFIAPPMRDEYLLHVARKVSSCCGAPSHVP